MPAIGIVDPSHVERKSDRSGRLPKWLSKDEVLDAAFRADPRWSPYPFELLAAGLAQIQSRGSAITTTALVAPCPRSVVLERLAPYVLRMDDVWRAFRGTMVHYVLEGTARPNSIAEHRFHTDFAGEGPISCSPDLVTPDTIWDYKNTAKNPVYDYPYTSHSEQLQLNRYIVNNATRVEKDDEVATAFPFDYRSAEFKHLAVVYLDIDGPKPIEVMRSVKQEGKRNRRVPNIWSDDQVVNTFRERYITLNAALDAYPEWPEGIETTDWWGGSTDWTCPGWPYCPLKGKCLAARWPDGLTW